MSTSFIEYTAIMPADLMGGEAEMLRAFLREHHLIFSPKREKRGRPLRFAVGESDCNMEGDPHYSLEHMTPWWRWATACDDSGHVFYPNVEKPPRCYADEFEQRLIGTLLDLLIARGDITLFFKNSWCSNGSDYPGDGDYGKFLRKLRAENPGARIVMRGYP